MNEVFPPICTVSLDSAQPGSIVRIPRSGGSIFALIAEKQPGENGHSFVVLNSSVPNRPAVFFANNWRNENSCMAYKAKLHFELSVDEADLDIRGHDLWEVPGVIVSVGDQFFIRAGSLEPFHGGFHYVNIQTGALLSGQLPNDTCTFAAWQIWLRDTYDRNFCILKFKFSKKVL